MIRRNLSTLVLLALCLFAAALHARDARASAPARHEVTGGLDLVFDPPSPDLCGSGPVRLIGSVTLGADIDDVIQMQAIVDLQTAGGSLPPFWQFGKPDECNVKNIYPKYDDTPWTCGPIEVFSGFGGPNRSRFVITSHPESPITLPAGTTTVFVLEFNLPEAALCAGCATPAAIVFNSLSLETGTCPPGCPCETLGAPDLVRGDVQLRNTPNPFRTSTAIDFQLPREGRVKLDVFDLDGRLVKHLHGGPLDAGAHSMTWDGTRWTGSRASAGVYFCRLGVDGFTETRRMVVMP